MKRTGPPATPPGMAISTTWFFVKLYILPEGISEDGEVPLRICRRTGTDGDWKGTPLTVKPPPLCGLDVSRGQSS